MNMNPQDQAQLAKYTMVAKKVIYNPQRMSAFLKMMGTKQGAVTAVHTVVAAIDKLKPVPPQIAPFLGVNAYMIMVDVAQEVTGRKADPAILRDVTGAILSEIGGQQPQQAPQDQGMLAQMQEQGEPAGDGPGPDNTAAHEQAEAPAVEQQEGMEEDEQPGLLAQMQRRGVPA